MTCLRLTTFLLGLALVSGCASSGPNHVYLTTVGASAVHDLGPPRAEISGGLKPGERALGLAYDFNTDHLFVRVTPAQVIRVIERPSGQVLREMPLPEDLRTPVSADLAIRSGDRHLFAAHPDGRSVVELTLFGQVVRRIELRGAAGPVGGLAYDQKNDRLLALTTSSPARIDHVMPDGSVTHCVTLAGSVRPVSLGYDSAAGHFFVPLSDGVGLGEFDATGNLLFTHKTDDVGAITALDAGPRSFLRVF